MAVSLPALALLSARQSCGCLPVVLGATAPRGARLVARAVQSAVPVELPHEPEVPVARITGPSVLSVCDGLTLSGALSSAPINEMKLSKKGCVCGCVGV